MRASQNFEFPIWHFTAKDKVTTEVCFPLACTTVQTASYYDQVLTFAFKMKFNIGAQQIGINKMYCHFHP